MKTTEVKVIEYVFYCYFILLIVGVVLFNHSEVEFKVNLHDRIAQLIIEKITDTNIQEVNSLDETSRGAGGFGSTGVAINSDNKIQPEPTQTNGHSSCK